LSSTGLLRLGSITIVGKSGAMNSSDVAGAGALVAAALDGFAARVGFSAVGSTFGLRERVGFFTSALVSTTAGVSFESAFFLGICFSVPF
jgi:hypothetical protein